MLVYINDIKTTNPLYLYDSESNAEISEDFIRIFSDNGLSELSSEEQVQFNTNAHVVMSAEIFNMWVNILKRQQKIIDDASNLNIPKSIFSAFSGKCLI